MLNLGVFLKPALVDLSWLSFIFYNIFFTIFYYLGIYSALNLGSYGIEFLLSFNENEVILRSQNYYQFITRVALLFAITFQLPLVTLFLLNKRILNIQLLTENRAELFIFILIISAIVTPTGDPVSLFVFTIPLYVLMEITIFIHKKFKVKFELDNFQKQAIKSLLDGLNVLVTAPTGSGKTLIAEKGIEKYIEDGKKVIYTTPIKALSNQKFNDFQNEGIDTGLLTGDRNENPNANLIIATTEILRNMIFSEDERINEIGLVILDEVHYLADKERGATWEEIIIHLPKKIKILGLSATIGNENEFLSWIVSQRGPTDLIKSNIRPVPLEISLVTATQNDDQITTIKSTKDKKNKRIFQFDKKYRKFKKPTLSNQLEFISLKNSTPSIFFFFSRDKVESKARHASNLIGKTTDNHDLKVLFDSVFGDLTSEEFNLLNLDELLDVVKKNWFSPCWTGTNCQRICRTFIY